MSIFAEFAEDIERRKRRLETREIWHRLRGPISTEMFFWAALFLVALGSFISGIVMAGLVAGR